MADFWDPPQQKLPIVLLDYGPPKVGKTYNALMLAPEPVYVADTEQRADLVLQQAIAAGRDVRRKMCPNLAAVKEVVIAALSDAQKRRKADSSCTPGTFVFDSGSDLQDMSEDEYLQESKADKIYPRVVWRRVYDKMRSLIENLKRAGFNIVVTGREKEVFKGENPTGEVTFKGWKDMPYAADIVVRSVRTKEGLVRKVVRNGLTIGGPSEIVGDRTWDQLMDELVYDPNKKAMEN